jgi:tetratricopeptide (TPR) repeat protein
MINTPQLRTKLDSLFRQFYRLPSAQIGQISRLLLGLAGLFFVVGLFLPGAMVLRVFLWVVAWFSLVAGLMLNMLRPHLQARALVEDAHSFVAKGQHRQAWQAAQKAVELVPFLAKGYAVRSSALLGLGYIDMAVDDADKAVRLAPKLPESRLARAQAFSVRGLHEDAVGDLQIGLRARPDWITGYQVLAATYVKLQEYEKSLETLQQLDKKLGEYHAPISLRYDNNLHIGWLHENRLYNLKRATAYYGIAIRLMPKQRRAYLRRAQAYHHQGQQNQASEDLLRAAQCQPTDEDAGKYHWETAGCYLSRYTITRNEADLKNWLAAIQESIRCDSPEYAAQAQAALDKLLKPPTSVSFPPQITFSPN